MFKKLIVILIVLMLIMTGCSSSKVNGPSKVNKPSKLAKDTILISFRNYNTTLYKNITVERAITFDIISDKALEDNISLFIDIKTPYKLFVEKNNIEEMPYFVFQNYQKIDWNKMYNLHLKAEPDKDQKLDDKAVKEYSDYQNLYIKSYEKTKEENINKDSFCYKGTIVFYMDSLDISENELFQDIKLTVNNKEYSFNIGRVELDYKTKIDPDGTYLVSNTLVVSDKNIFPNSQGELLIKDGSFTCSQDLQINGFRVLNSNVDIQEISLITEENGISLDKKFSQSQPILCKKNTNIIPVIKLKDNNFIDKMLYSTVVYLVVDYEIDGVKYSNRLEAMYRTKPDFHELLAIEYDKIDFLPYYNEFFNLNRGE